MDIAFILQMQAAPGLQLPPVLMRAANYAKDQFTQWGWLMRCWIPGDFGKSWNLKNLMLL